VHLRREVDVALSAHENVELPRVEGLPVHQTPLILTRLHHLHQLHQEVRHQLQQVPQVYLFE